MVTPSCHSWKSRLLGEGPPPLENVTLQLLLAAVNPNAEGKEWVHLGTFVGEDRGPLSLSLSTDA